VYRCEETQIGGNSIDFSILCLTTDFIHQGHEKRKEIRLRRVIMAKNILRRRSVWNSVTEQ